ncbi:glycosyltransferase family 1 protein [Paucibacter sp. APW11]|uniref:Glycosyltransferase family 1 protein n=1 Tax=Roseateles aquae TaxID=3077235 RepID=A0ABU3PFX8_9BURK|nr:glycosyltransferase family 1 protein [Paucibacter sp. APW11]MDT9001257.1 glycosyltransferase family 1 protein [Paucibacter sp. APW11]
MTTLHIDGIIYSLQRQGGISVYFNELLARLWRDKSALTLTLESPLLQGDISTRQLGAPACTICSRPARRLERYRSARVEVGVRSPTVFHSSYYRRPENSAQPSVVTVHDFAYERLQSGPRRWIHSWQKFAAIRQAQHVICISEATRDDLLEYVGIRADQTLHVIPNGVSETFRPLNAASVPTATTPFVLFVGQRGGYKNFARLLQALSLLPADIELHCVGGGALHEDELAGVAASVRARVKHLGYVDDEALNRCYNEALCLAYVSRYEGFGIPVIEAMRAGCPVLSVPCKAVIEVGGNALLICDDEAESIAAGIMCLTDQDERAKRRNAGLEVASGFGWERTYQATRAVYRALGTD